MLHAVFLYRALHLRVAYHSRQGDYLESFEKYIGACLEFREHFIPSSSQQVYPGKASQLSHWGLQKTAVWKVDSVPCVQYFNESNVSQERHCFSVYGCDLCYYNEGGSAKDTWTLSFLAKLATSSKHPDLCPPQGLLALECLCLKDAKMPTVYSSDTHYNVSSVFRVSFHCKCS